ncbi:hypothetical protein L13192_07127 [Pyrenophora tritici-repentis]|nr:hypothetical protein L13192_07127 [Pyrenophora tritici-repentis]
MANAVDSHISFVARDPSLDTVKPYSFRCSPPDGLSRENFDTGKQPLQIRDARCFAPDIAVNGFCLADIPTAVPYEQFFQTATIESTYVKELQAGLREVFQARHVRVVDYQVRQRHPAFPQIDDGTDASLLRAQPANLAHIDFTYDEAVNMLKTLYGKAADELLRHRWQLINTWRPLKGPLLDWPLAVCDASSFDSESDGIAADAVYSTWSYENILVHHNPKQRWHYFSRQLPNELLLFKCSGSDPSEVGPCPHASFPINSSEGVIAPRESIEARAFVFDAPIAEFPKQIGRLYGEKD